MDEEILRMVLSDAIERLFNADADMIMNGVAERSICGRLQVHLSGVLAEYGVLEYFADVEYNRKQGGQIKTILDGQNHVIPITCDLIVHSRGSKILQDNLITIEMKKSTRPKDERLADRMRLRAMTKVSFDDVWSADGRTHPTHVCGYLLGVYIILDLQARLATFEYYRRGAQYDEEILPFHA
jgi:hypothetical protein